MQLKLGKTYYSKGFFNLTSKIVSEHINKTKGNCEFEILGKVFNYSFSIANKQGQIRVIGGKALLHFFQENFKENEVIEVKILKCS